MDPELVKGTLSLLILSLLSREPMYGYQISATVKRETDGAFQWKEGSLYPALHKLEKDGLVRARWKSGQANRRRKYYHLTEKGRAVLREKRRSWEELSEAVRTILEKSDG
ncbi:MAG: PadR family transcriptional regulator [Planctomycetota bacterium]|jgi:PadR family transcriptional regulator PadR